MENQYQWWLRYIPFGLKWDWSLEDGDGKLKEEVVKELEVTNEFKKREIASKGVKEFELLGFKLLKDKSFG